MITSELLNQIPGLVHAFGTRDDEAPLGRSLLPKWTQVHGTGVAEASEPGQELGEVDAIWSKSPRVVVAVVTADCVPVLFARSDGSRVAAVHSGWRGTRARISTQLWKELQAQGERPQNWIAAIGPAIGGCCYEVSEELARDFALEFCAGAHRLLPRSEALPAPRMLDLPAIQEAELRRIGISQVDRLRFCTLCARDGSSKPLFHSYRSKPGEGRQLSQIQVAR